MSRVALWVCGLSALCAAACAEQPESQSLTARPPSAARPDVAEASDEGTFDAAQAPAPRTRDAGSPMEASPDPADAAVHSDAQAGPAFTDAATVGDDAAGGSPVQRRGLSGAFVLVTNDRSATFYRTALAEMADLQMHDVIVQTESFLQAPDFSRNAVDRALLGALLDQASALGLQVHLGLALPEWGNGDVAAADDPAFIDGVIEASEQSFDGLLAEFGQQPAWTGVYLPLELWTPGSADGLGQLPRYVAQVTAHVKQARALSVAMSPFISTLGDGDGAATEAAYAAIFDNAAVDIVALQDGVGARSVPVSQLGDNLPYYQAMLRACEGRCEVWANVESFDGEGPAQWERFLAQMQTLATLVPAQLTYEYTHYLMPSGSGGADAAALHADYAAWLAAP